MPVCRSEGILGMWVISGVTIVRPNRLEVKKATIFMSFWVRAQMLQTAW